MFPISDPALGTYWVLDTDYYNWASVYSCTDTTIIGRLSIPARTSPVSLSLSLRGFWDGLLSSLKSRLVVRLHMRQSNHMRHTVLQLTTAYDAFTSRGIDISNIVPTEQIDCAYEKPEDTCADDL